MSLLNIEYNALLNVTTYKASEFIKVVIKIMNCVHSTMDEPMQTYAHTFFAATQIP